MPNFRVIWPDGYGVEVEADKVKHARRRAERRRQETTGYVTSDAERRALDVRATRDTDMDVCVVAQARDGGWWLIMNPEREVEPPSEPTLPCPHCERPVKITMNTNDDNLPGRPFVLWEFKDRDDAEGLCSIVNVMILCAVMAGAVGDEPEPAVVA